MTALQIIQDLMSKSAATFLDHFARLGIYNKVLVLANSSSNDDEDENKEKVE